MKNPVTDGPKMKSWFKKIHSPQNCQSPILSRVPGSRRIMLNQYYPEFAEYYKTCDPETKRWFVTHAKKDWVYCYAGANTGVYSILFSLLSPQGYAYSFERSSTVKNLRANINYYKINNVEVVQKTLGKITGKTNDKNYRIWGRPGERCDVEFTTLDKFFFERPVSRLDCIKIDVDSFDLDVLKGSFKTLKKFNPFVVVELNHALALRGRSNS